MRVLLTGAAGFIGSRVALELVRRGHDVVGVDNLSDAYDPRLKRWRLAHLVPKRRFEFQRVDISRRSAVNRLLARHRPQAILNLAARAGVRPSITDPWLYYETNLYGTLNLLEAARTCDVKTFVLASTSSLYGAHNPRPFKEMANTDRPLSPYAASKKAAEVLTATYNHLYGLHTPILRYFTVYGPAGRPDMSIFRFIHAIARRTPLTLYGDGTQERDFTYVDDVARATVSALRVRGAPIINVGGDRPVSMRQVLSLIQEELGAKANIQRLPRHPADVQATWASIDRAKRLLSWTPRTSLEEGIRNTVSWYHENASWIRRIRFGDA